MEQSGNEKGSKETEVCYKRNEKARGEQIKEIEETKESN
jgi:hypothetical protein